MRNVNVGGAATMAALVVLALPLRAAAAEEPFDACDIFTQEDAQKALGTAAAPPPEPVNAKTKRPVARPKVVPVCTYTGFKDGKAVAATAHFRFGKTEGDAKNAFDDNRLKFQTKPMLISGAEAFWSSKTGEMNLRKGRTWVTVAVGPDKLSERDSGDAKRLAEILARKL
jgi:hypothetical protein